MSTARFALLPLLILSGAATAAPPEVLETGPAYRWVATVEGHHGDFDPGPDRDDTLLSLRRHFSRGSFALEDLRARQAGLEGTALAADAYAKLWPGAYANLRSQKKTEGDLFPDRSHRVELYQALPGGWEPAVSWDRLTFGGEHTELYGAALGLYVGNFYLRARAVKIPSADANTYRAMARWYYRGDGDTYLEGAAGTGRSAEDLSEGLPATDTKSASAAWVWYFLPRWGMKLSADWSSETGGGDLTEQGVGAALYARW